MEAADVTRKVQQRSLRIGWLALAVFLSLGIGLEGLHGFKVDWYVNAANQTRRLMLTLAHAHGTLLGLLHLALAASLGVAVPRSPRVLQTISTCLLAATFLLPGGFLLGGIWIYDGDPGLGIFLVPAGALPLLVAVVLAAFTLRAPPPPAG